MELNGTVSMVTTLQASVQSAAGGSDYKRLQNKPSINGVTLTGDKKLTDLGLEREMDRLLPGVIETALSEAKESGEFDGAPGAVPQLVIGTVTTLPAGSDASAAIRGTAENPVLDLGIPRGVDGKTDISGSSMTPLFANSVEECTDTSRVYVLPDGMIWAYTAVSEAVKDYTNLADPTDEMWAENNRINSSGGNTPQAGATATNLIPVEAGDVVRVKGLTLGGWNIAFYSGNKAVQSAAKPAFPSSGAYTYAEIESDGVFKFTFVETTTAKFIRFSGVLVGTSEDVIITVNEEISERTGTVYRWTNTGHAFVAADYEDRILDLETESEAQAAQIDLIHQQINNMNPGTDTAAYPSAWNDAVEACISKIKALQKAGGKNCITFPFFSDNHQRLGYAGALIAKIMRQCHIPYCFYGGDSISSGYIAGEEAMIAQDKAFDDMMSPIPNGRLCRAVGNHDGYWAVSASERHTYTPEQIYDLFLREESIAQNKHFGENGTYYYVEDIACKVRWIVLNDNGGSYDAAQIAWLENTALSFSESGWSVVFISHRPITNNYHSGISNAQTVQNILTAYVHSATENKAEVVGWFAGHIHRDRIYQTDHTGKTGANDETTVTLPWKTVTITSDANLDYSADDGLPVPTRSMNGDTGHAIDFVTINKAAKTVNITRLGVGSDRSFSY